MKEPKVLYRVLVGSQSYGTSTPESDEDHKSVYIQDIDDILSFRYKEQINHTKDDCSYEIKRFLELLRTANPTVLEMLYSPDDCIISKDPSFDLLLEHKDKFLTKQCLNSFAGYAIQQIKKANGLDKKMNWEKERVERKTPIDFIYAEEGGKTIPITVWLKNTRLKQEFCGLVALDHFKDSYALYYNAYGADPDFYDPILVVDSPKRDLKYKGIITDESNSLRLSNVPKGEQSIAIVYYNKDGYSMHCKDYKEYQEWLANRNTQRYVDNIGHNQQIDSKNLLHTRRLLDMAMEIANTGKISVRRPNADYLLSIRRGEVSLVDIIQQAEYDIKGLDELFKNSNLPDRVDDEFVNDLLLKIRYQNYKLKLWEK